MIRLCISSLELLLIIFTSVFFDVLVSRIYDHTISINSSFAPLYTCFWAIAIYTKVSSVSKYQRVTFIFLKDIIFDESVFPVASRQGPLPLRCSFNSWVNAIINIDIVHTVPMLPTFMLLCSCSAVRIFQVRCMCLFLSS
jgi:hypothetical protein